MSYLLQGRHRLEGGNSALGEQREAREALGGARRVRGVLRNRGVSANIDAPEIEVAVESSATLNSEMELGVFWPMEVYNATVGEQYKLCRSDCVAHMHNGRRYFGIIRDTVHGVPRGCMRLTDSDNTSVVKKQKIADTRIVGVSAASATDTFDKVRGAIATIVGKKIVKDSDGTEKDILTLTTKGGLEAFDKDDDFDGDWLGVVNKGWGKLAGQREKSSAKRRRSARSRSSSSCRSPTRGSSKHSRALSDKSVKNAPPEKRDGTPSAKKPAKDPRAVFPSEQQRALNMANSVSMEAKEMLNMVGSPDGPALSLAKVRKMIAKVGAKLDISSKRVLTYAGPGGNDPAHASMSDQGQARLGG